MGALNTEQSNVEAVTALTNAPTIRKLLRVPDEEGKTNFEILSVQSIKELANGHNCEVTIRVDLAYGHEGLPVPENERYSVRTETVRRIDLKEVAAFAELELNDKQQYIGDGSTIAKVATLLGANLTEDDITVSPIKDVFWVRAKDNSVGYTGMLTIAPAVAAIKPTSVAMTVAGNTPAIGELFTPTVTVLPANAANKTVTLQTSDATVVAVENGKYRAIKPGTAKLTAKANGDNTVVSSEVDVTVVDPNAAASFEAKLTFKSSYGSQFSENMAGFLNAGDIVNLIVKSTGLVANKAVVIEMDSAGIDFDIDSAEQTLTPAGDLVVPVIVNSSTPTDSLMTILIKDKLTGAVLTATAASRVQDPAIVPTVILVPNTPPNIPANQQFGGSADIGVVEYTPREIVWSSVPAAGVTITPDVNNPLSFQVQLGNLAVDTKVVLTCTVDGVSGSSAEINIIALP